MKRNPRLDIYLDKIKNNSENIKALCLKHGIKVVGITKGCCAITEVGQAMIDGGINILGDSRIENLKVLKKVELKAETMLIRIPMLSEVDRVLDWADISLNSEISVIKSLSQKALKRKIVHRIILMIDLGDLREGIMPDDALQMVGEIRKLPGVKLIGLGANFCCVSGVMPTRKNLTKLVELTEEIENNFHINLEVISGGDTSVLKLVENDIIPNRINQLRIGVGILLGQDDVRLRNIAGTYQDTFILTAEVIEVKEKPSLPRGEIGRDAFGEVPVFQDLGIRKRAILAIGKQDIHLNSLVSLEKEVKIVGASSDHLIIDITDFKEEIKVGDEVKFKLNYPALLSVTTSKYINKYFHRKGTK
ncbi:alanine/ornithine racemase family PLP-dependent enzyme [Candidatus Atribacteria bacterium MT.SAG.1]|nr:alanine/ornithine racemase family PLP-dependent enzyme [Candidatus Atribacteria bacterium MT.SAG.1]